MFTGIIEAVATVTGVEEGPGRRRLWLDLARLADFDLRPGDSLAVNGACLTAAAIRDTSAAFDVVAETLERTTLGRFAPGTAVNVERALRAGDRLGGHFVLGHVDGVGTVETLEPQAGQTLLVVRAPTVVPTLVDKGSLAVDGVSLTVARLAETTVAVALVPFTLEHTTLGHRRPGDRVNLETDLLGKYVRTYLSACGPSRVDEGFLREHGFA